MIIVQAHHIQRAVAKVLATKPEAIVAIYHQHLSAWYWARKTGTDTGHAYPRADGTIKITFTTYPDEDPIPDKQIPGPCPCVCNANPVGFCGGCGHAGCGRR